MINIKLYKTTAEFHFSNYQQIKTYEVINRFICNFPLIKHIQYYLLRILSQHSQRFIDLFCADNTLFSYINDPSILTHSPIALSIYFYWCFPLIVTNTADEKMRSLTQNTFLYSLPF